MEIRFVSQEEYGELLKASRLFFDGCRVWMLPQEQRSAVSSPLFTLEEAADNLRMSPRKLSQLCRDGKIRHCTDGGKYLFTEEMLMEYIDNHTVPVKQSVVPVTKPARRAEQGIEERKEEFSEKQILEELRSLRKEAE